MVYLIAFIEQVKIVKRYFTEDYKINYNVEQVSPIIQDYFKLQ